MSRGRTPHRCNLSPRLSWSPTLQKETHSLCTHWESVQTPVFLTFGLGAEFAVCQSGERHLNGSQSRFRSPHHFGVEPTQGSIHCSPAPFATSDIHHGYESASHSFFIFETYQFEETEEALQVHAFFGKHVLEVFVNERTVISTRIYHLSDQCVELRFFAQSIINCPEDKAIVLLQVTAWDGHGKN
ncbi:hypothetical protein EDB80DRAFT_684377 [Ilyonectria destructans]|nr:hypothetical protein EDB80DRAFT_684377 [Ilyonectria destructans]